MYEYKRQRAALFTDEGQRMFLRTRDYVQKLLAASGAVTMEAAMKGSGGGDSWDMIACVDRLVELGELREIPQSNVAVQHRVFVKG